ncbi:hypothetical protein C8R43DRAFT_1121035 [Mycena crocata]|nr:hypothetical protein C8R43DRAFT_1121035 [Mycena crocata]
MPAKGHRKPKPRVLKELRQNLRLWAEGERENILSAHIERYADALERGWREERDVAQSIFNEFHAKISWKLKDHEEPELPLPEYDPLATEVEEDLTPEEEVEKRARITLLNKRIRRWLKYRVRRLLKNLHARLDPRKDPWAVLMAKLSNMHAPPKARQAYQQFMHEQWSQLIPVIAERWKATVSAGSNVQTAKDANGPFRAQVARDVFAALPEEERASYGERARAEAATAREAYQKAMTMPPSKSPESRHECIENLGTFMGPILQGIHERTGLHSVLLLGGPLPKYGGELKTIYVSYGRSRANGQHFPEWAKERWAGVTELMKEYLTASFSPQEQAESALPEELLAGAKYTISPLNDDVSDSSDESDLDSNADSDDTDAEAKKQKREAKRNKTKPAKKTSATAATQPTNDRDVAEKATEVAGKGKVRARARAAGEKGSSKKGAAKTAKKGAAATGEGVSGTKKSPQKKRKRRQDSDANDSDSDDEDDGVLPPNTRVRKSQRLSTNTANKAAKTSADLDPNAAGSQMDVDTPVSPPLLPSAPPASRPPPPSPPIALPPPPPPVIPWTPGSAPPPPSSTVMQALPSLGSAPPITASAAGPAVKLQMPANAPTWLVESIAHLSQKDLGCHFTSVLTALVRLEEAAGLEIQESKRTRLPSDKKVRPAEIQTWIRGGRGSKTKIHPKVTIAKYPAKFITWWDSLQPKWRKRDAKGRLITGGAYGTDWGVLDCSGANGCLSAVAGLYFWGIVQMDNEQQQLWDDTVQDVAWVLEGVRQLYK